MAISNHTGRVRKTKGRLERAKVLVVTDREVMGGEPYIRGTRVWLCLIGALANAHGVSETHSAYPFLTKQQIELAALYVTEHPGKRRPRRIRFPKGNNGDTRLLQEGSALARKRGFCPASSDCSSMRT